VACLSHLPQLLSIALMNVAARACPAGDLPLAGPGFRDMTRLASSPGDLWQAILASNGDEVGDAARGVIAEISRLLERARAGDVAASFDEANQHRERLERTSVR
jgi:prephenate dehydrogenase